ncbi:Recombinase [uncultured Roseburia sp.]|uniref:Recombinase family protein n=1 Tax=Brotonthovivens ammoniilytica TaxID=2981725 RepID=A0ABT2TMC2_9FIRM|nr:recombinase family protein [Brotonthovivens ammoniilytica]MCU6763311.1 recombinase family protein [Brotonthovivens ammoniilytica]SCJ12891.1 Recombinase [uncultured Roseburia sp.]
MARIRKQSFSAAPKKIIWYIAIYIRISRDDGSDESLSVSNQRKILLEFLKKSFQDEHVVTDIYIDDGQSGTDYERPGFQRMIHDVETGKVNCIICKNLSRAFRNYSDQGYFLESFFPRFNTRFITLSDPKIDTFINPETVNGMEVPINGLMNDRFAYKTSSDIRRTFDTKRRNGEFIGAFAPYGYAKDTENKNHLIIDPEAAQVVKDIFHWYVYGDGSTEVITDRDGTKYKRLTDSMSKESIARKLNNLGIPNPAAYKRSKGMKYHNSQADKNDGLWQSSSITTILSNEMYIGTMVQGKQKVISYKVHDKITIPEDKWYRVPNTHKPIISSELFHRVQELQAKDTRRAPGKKQNYLFSGFLRCADCKKAMTRKPSKNLIYYNCSTYKRKSKTKCSIHSIRLDVLEPAVLTAIQRQIELAVHLPEIIDKIKKAPAAGNKSAQLEALLKLRTQELKKTENIITDLYLDWKNGDITHNQYRKMKVKFETQSRQLKVMIKHLKENIKVIDEDITCGNPYLNAFLKYKNVQTLTQGILLELVKDIFIHEGGGITIVFKFEDPFKRIIDFIENNKYVLAAAENKADRGT